jgi:hypothetical protein
MVDLRGALNGVGAAANVAGSGLAWMGHEAAQAPGAAVQAGQFLGGLSHRSNVDFQADFLAKDLRDHGVPEADAWQLARQVAQSLDVNTTAKRAAAVQIALRQWRLDVHRHGR